MSLYAQFCFWIVSIVGGLCVLALAFHVSDMAITKVIHELDCWDYFFAFCRERYRKKREAQEQVASADEEAVP